MCGLGLCLALIGTAAQAACDPAKIVQLDDGSYVRPGRHGVVFEGANVATVGFVVGRRCVAVIDTGGSEAEGRALDCAIGQVTDVPVCYVINTHVHPDHILGNIVFQRPHVTFVGHARLARDMSLVGRTYLARAERSEGRSLPPGYLVPPSLTVDDSLTLDLGERRLRLTAHAVAHSGADLTVYDESNGTLWAGDLVFLDHVPVLDGSVIRWLQVLDELADLPAPRVIPGHGPPGARWPDAAADTRRYLTALRDELRSLLNTNADLMEVQERVALSEKTHWLLFDQYHKRNIARAFAELEWEN